MKIAPSLGPGQRRDLWRELRAPLVAFLVLMLCLGVIVLLATLAASRIASVVEFALLVCMVLTMLLFSMEVREEKSLLRFFAALGFIWVGVLFGMTMVDYLTR